MIWGMRGREWGWRMGAGWGIVDGAIGFANRGRGHPCPFVEGGDEPPWPRGH